MAQKDLYLKLNSEDADVLEIELRIRLENLRFELARTKDYDYRIGLRRHLNRLESIDGELKSLFIEKKSA
jgi:hypothetical protein